MLRLRSRGSEALKGESSAGAFGSFAKFKPPKDPLEHETFLKHIQPENEEVENVIVKWMESEIENALNMNIPAEKQAKLNAIHMLKHQYEQSKKRGETYKKFSVDFIGWLMGKGTNADHCHTPWKRIPLKFPDITSYLNTFVDKRYDFMHKLEQLRRTGPTDLLTSYLYFKYIVRKHPVSLDNIDFLQEFDMWANTPPFYAKRFIGDTDEVSGGPRGHVLDVPYKEYPYNDQQRWIDPYQEDAKRVLKKDKRSNDRVAGKKLLYIPKAWDGRDKAEQQKGYQQLLGYSRSRKAPTFSCDCDKASTQCEEEEEVPLLVGEHKRGRVPERSIVIEQDDTVDNEDEEPFVENLNNQNEDNMTVPIVSEEERQERLQNVYEAMRAREAEIYMERREQEEELPTDEVPLAEKITVPRHPPVNPEYEADEQNQKMIEFRTMLKSLPPELNRKLHEAFEEAYNDAQTEEERENIINRYEEQVKLASEAVREFKDEELEDRYKTLKETR